MLRHVRRISGRSYTGPLFPRTPCCAFPLLARWWLHKDCVKILYKIRLWHGILRKQQVWPTFLWPKNSRNPAKVPGLQHKPPPPAHCAAHCAFIHIENMLPTAQSINQTLGSLLKQTLSIVFVFLENDSWFYLVADFVWPSCFSQVTELSFKGQKHWKEQTFTQVRIAFCLYDVCYWVIWRAQFVTCITS